MRPLFAADIELLHHKFLSLSHLRPKHATEFSDFRHRKRYDCDVYDKKLSIPFRVLFCSPLPSLLPSPTSKLPTTISRTSHGSPPYVWRRQPKARSPPDVQLVRSAGLSATPGVDLWQRLIESGCIRVLCVRCLRTGALWRLPRPRLTLWYHTDLHVPKALHGQCFATSARPMLRCLPPGVRFGKVGCDSEERAEVSGPMPVTFVTFKLASWLLADSSHPQGRQSLKLLWHHPVPELHRLHRNQSEPTRE